MKPDETGNEIFSKIYMEGLVAPGDMQVSDPSKGRSGFAGPTLGNVAPLCVLPGIKMPGPCLLSPSRRQLCGRLRITHSPALN